MEKFRYKISASKLSEKSGTIVDECERKSWGAKS